MPGGAGYAGHRMRLAANRLRDPRGARDHRAVVPVVQEGQAEPTPAPEVYSSRQIVVYAQDGQTEVARAQIDGRGNYRVTLAAATYVVDINHAGIDVAKELPKTVRIAGGETTCLDADIDTGIR